MSSSKWFEIVGSAVLISVACIDPGNLEGDISGALAMHYRAIFVLLFSHFLLFFVQEMSFVMGVRSGKDLAQLIKMNYNPKLKIFIWISQELAIIAADIQEILGAVIGLKLIFTGLNDTLAIFIILVIVIGILFL